MVIHWILFPLYILLSVLSFVWGFFIPRILVHDLREWGHGEYDEYIGKVEILNDDGSLKVATYGEGELGLPSSRGQSYPFKILKVWRKDETVYVMVRNWPFQLNQKFEL